jgi:hypothetical protein
MGFGAQKSRGKGNDCHRDTDEKGCTPTGELDQRTADR